MAFTDGIEYLPVGGGPVPVFDAAETVAVCFKYRNRIGLELALEALREMGTRKIYDERNTAFQAVDRVAIIMRPYLESLAS